MGYDLILDMLKPSIFFTTNDKHGGRQFVELLILLLWISTQVSCHLKPSTDITIRKEPGVCQSKDIRNSVEMLSQLKDCVVVEGFVQIVLIDKANFLDYSDISFPNLTEITDYLLLYRVHGMYSIGKIFPNLSVIRGNSLFLNYALIVYEMLHLQEVGLTSLTNILRGGVYIAKNPVLCFVDTINWDQIADKGRENNYITENKLQNECLLCPKNNQTCPKHPKKQESLCWNSQQCQKECPKCSEGISCTTDGECCHESCLGGCYGPGNDNCFVCKKFLWQQKCVDSCPANTYEYLNRRCVLESECYDMLKPRELIDFDKRHNPWKPFNGTCLLSCPNGFVEKEIVYLGQVRYKCELCKGICKKECLGANVDSIASAQKLKGCTSITGALEIQIRGGSNVVKELEENLNMIEEIHHYLKIVRSFPLVSLNFLHKLKIIHGEKLEYSKYALVVLDNQNLEELWDWKNRDSNLTIAKGKLFFHFNPKLCLSKIEELKNVTNLDPYTEMEVASNSNGDKVACTIVELVPIVSKRDPTIVILKWHAFNHYDPRTLLGYVVHYIEAPYKNVTIYDERDACGGDGWRVVDVTPESGEIHCILIGLTPYTQYAFYVKTYTIATEKSGAQSNITYFRTMPDTPTEPRSLTVFSNFSSVLVITWQPPLKPNGNVTHYIVVGHYQKYSEEFIEQRDCTESYAKTDIGKSPVKPKEEKLKPDERSQNCSCEKKIADVTQREKEIDFEDQLQNHIYVKRTDTTTINVRKKREEGISDPPEIKKSSIAGMPDTFTETVYGSTSLVMKNLRHFSFYNIAVRACREIEDDERSDKKEKNCSPEALATARTNKLDTADNVDSNSLISEVSNKTVGQVALKWNEPSLVNGHIVSYHIALKRADIENIQPTILCVQRNNFRKAGNTHSVTLPPGNYSFRVRATSLAGESSYTREKFFYIEEVSSLSGMMVLFITTIVILLATAILLFATIYFRRQYSQVPSRKLIASVNPEYVPTVYEPDDWEVPRSRVDLLKEIGQGSFGMVYEGILRSSNDGLQEQRCAIKTVNVQAADRDRIEFLNEASVMKAFNTHHVVKLLGVVSQGQPTLVVMELMANGDLKSYLRSHRPDSGENPYATPPTLNRILRMAAEIADGMAYLSAKKFVHRDLAARNCMVSDDLTVKIGDFGMTRDIYETEYYRKGSKGLLPVRWMAPESLKDGVFTSHSDGWSYGVVLYEMVTLASQPYQGLSNDQVLRYVIDGGVMERPENCPDKLYRVMRLCWHQKPSNRPSFLELVRILHQDVGTDFQAVSFYDSDEGIELRGALGGEETPLSITRDIEDFSMSDDEDYKQPRSSTSSKVSNGSTTPNGYVPQQVKTTKC